MSPLRRPGLADVGLVVLCVLLMAVETAVTDKIEASPGAAVAIVVAALPLLVRRRWPTAAFVVGFVAILGVIETDGPYNTMPAPVVICAYTAAQRYGRRWALWAVALSVPFTLWILQTYSPHGLISWGTAQNLALVVLPATLGVASHERRAATAALVARAEAAERSRDEEALRRVGEERLRIARDVHDVVAHAMVTINVQAGVGAYLLRSDPDQAHLALRTIKQVSGEALTDLRQVLGLLRAGVDGDTGAVLPGAVLPGAVLPGAGLPGAQGAGTGASGTRASDTGTRGGALGGAGAGPSAAGEARAGTSSAPLLPVRGLAALDDVREAMAAAGVDVTIEIDEAAGHLPTATDATLFRIAQEALTNTLRHAGPTSARVRVAVHGARVTLDVTDDGPVGVSAPEAAAGSGNGLRGMRERAEAAGGAVTAGPVDGGGWRVSAWLPLAVAPAEAGLAP